MVNISPEVVLGLSFLSLSNADIDFLVRELRWRTYTTEKAFSTTRQVELVGKKEFAAMTFDLEHETFVVYIVSPSSLPLNARLQISGLIAKEAPIKVLAKYLDFIDVFSSDLVSELPKHTKINDQVIELVDSQQPFYRSIYNRERVKLETLKAYIETNLANGFIRLSKSSAGTPILFDQKSDSSLRLCVD